MNEINAEKEKFKKAQIRITDIRRRIAHRQKSLEELQQEEDTSLEKERIRAKIKELLNNRYVRIQVLSGTIYCGLWLRWATDTVVY